MNRQVAYRRASDVPPSRAVPAAPPAEPEGPLYFYYDGSRDNKGPVAIPTLKGLLSGGVITLDSQVWCEGQGDWDIIENLPALKAKLGATKPALPARRPSTGPALPPR